MTDSQYFNLIAILFYILAAIYRNDSMKCFTTCTIIGISHSLLAATISIIGMLHK